MSNKQDYINSYIKENYKTVKIRIRKDDSLIINKLNSEKNKNKYILNLIRKDALDNRKYNYINNSIKIDFKVSHTMQDLIDKAEEADFNDDYGYYMNLADAIDTQAKKEVTRGTLKESQWNKLLMRYCL